MFVSAIFPDQPTTSHSLKVVKKISQGKFSVYHTQCPTQRTEYALKVFPKDNFGTTQYNKETIMFSFSHPNIIKHIPATISNGNEDRFSTILTEFAKYGDVFDMVVGNVFSSEILIRTYFHQIVAGLEYMHNQGVAHLDLKLENLMMGSGFSLKIIDFDQAQRTKDKKITSGGTEGFRAPEVIDGSCANFTAADIYSLGVILFAFKGQSTPFAEVTTQSADGKQNTSLKYYSSFIRNNQSFWEMKTAQKRDPTFFSEDFKELVNGMLQYDVCKRFTLEDIKKSKWFNGPILSEEKLRTEMRARWEIFQRK